MVGTEKGRRETGDGRREGRGQERGKSPGKEGREDGVNTKERKKQVFCPQVYEWIEAMGRDKPTGESLDLHPLLAVTMDYKALLLEAMEMEEETKRGADS